MGTRNQRGGGGGGEGEGEEEGDSEGFLSLKSINKIFARPSRSDNHRRFGHVIGTREMSRGKHFI